MIVAPDAARPPSDLSLRCRCGHVRGVARGLSPSAVFRFICYCKDCQAFARFLARPDVLNSAGGTDIVQMPPARVTLAAGADALRCLSLAGGSRVLRWYSACCRTPIANTAASPGFPLVAIIHCFIDRASDGRAHDAVLGPALCRIYDGSALGPLPPASPPPSSFGVSLRRASMVLRWWMRGLARPTPFFDERTNAPCSLPRVLTPGERAAL